MWPATQSLSSSARRRGFTIVELLIVIVVIGILAAITIVAYSGIQQRATASASQSAASQAAKKLAVYAVDNNDNYPPTLTAAGVNDTGGTTFQYSVSNVVSPKTFCITATTGTASYWVSNSSSTPTSGGCPGHGVGGVAAIANLAVNPSVVGSISGFFQAGAYAANTRTIATDLAHHGASSLKTVVNGTGQVGAMASVPSGGIRFNTGERLSWSFWIYSTKAGTITIYWEGRRVSDAAITGGSPTSVAVPANAWTKLTGTAVVATDVFVTGVGAYNLSVVPGDTIWSDEFFLQKGVSTSNYADGDSPGWAWSGSPNNSTSTGPPL